MAAEKFAISAWVPEQVRAICTRVLDDSSAYAMDERAVIKRLVAWECTKPAYQHVTKQRPSQDQWWRLMVALMDGATVDIRGTRSAVKRAAELIEEISSHARGMRECFHEYEEIYERFGVKSPFPLVLDALLSTERVQRIEYRVGEFNSEQYWPDWADLLEALDLPEDDRHPTLQSAALVQASGYQKASAATDFVRFVDQRLTFGISLSASALAAFATAALDSSDGISEEVVRKARSA
ncbi:MAG: hypothetical protein KIS79_06310 [Burkholderiales bacterium]|nr:hypothetical protein [Burkholderiales bacterium]